MSNIGDPLSSEEQQLFQAMLSASESSFEAGLSASQLTIAEVCESIQIATPEEIRCLWEHAVKMPRGEARDQLVSALQSDDLRSEPRSLVKLTLTTQDGQRIVIQGTMSASQVMACSDNNKSSEDLRKYLAEYSTIEIEFEDDQESGGAEAVY